MGAYPDSLGRNTQADSRLPDAITFLCNAIKDEIMDRDGGRS